MSSPRIRLEAHVPPEAAGGTGELRARMVRTDHDDATLVQDVVDEPAVAASRR